MYEMRLCILNTTKPYSDDEDGYTGAWFSCPVTFEEIKEKLGVEKRKILKSRTTSCLFP